MTNQTSFPEKYGIQIAIGSALFMACLIAGLFWVKDEQTSAQLEPASTVVAGQVDQPDASRDNPSTTDSTVGPGSDEAPLPDPATDGPFMTILEYDFHVGHYMNDVGFCSRARGHSALELRDEIEAAEGRRIEGFVGFKDGMIVRFKDGSRVAVWSREIDCKDPPYNPLNSEL